MSTRDYAGGEFVYKAAPTAGYTSGQVVELVDSATVGFIGVVQADASSGERAALKVFGVQTLPKTAGTGIAHAVGAPVYWTGSACVAAATGNNLIGRAAEVSVAADTTMKVLLNAK